MKLFSSRVSPYKILRLLGIVIALFLLAVSIEQLELKPGETIRFASERSEEDIEIVESKAEQQTRGREFPYLLIYLPLLLLLPFFVRKLKRIEWAPMKDKGWIFYFFLIGIVAICLFIVGNMIEFSSFRLNPFQLTDDTRIAAPETIRRYSGQIPKYVGLGLLLAVGGFIVLFVAIRRKRLLDSHSQESIAVEFGYEADKGLKRLVTGGSAREAIIGCYLNMRDLLNKRQKFTRRDSMTPGEFLDRLKEEDIGIEPVFELTKLFEQARYSQEQFSKFDAKHAKDILEQISDKLKS